jgi:hypothetical protein
MVAGRSLLAHAQAVNLPFASVPVIRLNLVMKSFRRFIASSFLIALGAISFQGCETMQEQAQERAAMNEAIRAEVPGNYFIGRRMYKEDYKMWGWVREPGQPWSTAKYVMFNEQQVLAPDRQKNDIGFDNNFEYRLTGYYSGQKVYEPASDRYYPEFVLTGYELRSTTPPMIYASKDELDPKIRLLEPPQ